MDVTSNENKKPSAFESALVATTEADIEIVACNVRFIKQFTYEQSARAMMVITHDGATKKAYCFADVVADLKAPFKAELLIEQKDGYWNVTAVTPM